MARAGIEPATLRFSGGCSYQLSYLAEPVRHLRKLTYGDAQTATLTGLEPATSAVTGRRANQLRYRAMLMMLVETIVPVETVLPYPLRDSNPRCRLERAVS